MPKVVAIRAWYAGGRTYASRGIALDAFWAALPETGVLAIMLYEDKATPAGYPMRRLLSGRDRYYRAGAIFAHTDAAEDEIRRLAPWPEIKRGDLVSDGEYEAVIRQAMAAKEP